MNFNNPDSQDTDSSPPEVTPPAWWVATGLPTPLTISRRAVLLGGLGVIVGGAGVLFSRRRGQVSAALTGRPRSRQFDRELRVDQLLANYARVFGVAHNAGDNLRTLRAALARGADVIEIDIVSMRGALYAAHSSPLRWIGPWFFRGLPLEKVWEETATVDAVMLDLKERSPRFLDGLFTFLDEHRGERRVIVSSGRASTLQAFAERIPEVFRVLGVSPPGRRQELRADPDLIALIDGVAIRQDLLDEATVAWLTAQNLRVFAWTVNDLRRMNELVSFGVDAITTDNLAILDLLGGQERGEERLVRRRLRPSGGAADVLPVDDQAVLLPGSETG